MSTHNSVKTITLLAGTDANNSLYRLVKASTSAAKTADRVSATTDTVIGVSAENVENVGDEFPVAQLQGVVEIEAGAAVTVGQLAVPDSVGRITGVAGIANIPTGSMSVGVILVAASAAGEVTEVWAQPMTTQLTA